MAEEFGKLRTSRMTGIHALSAPEFALLAEQVLAYVSNDLPQLKRLFFDELRPLDRSGAELFELHQLSVSQNHTHPVV